MRPAPTPPGPGQPSLDDLAAGLERIATTHHRGDDCGETLRSAADRLRGSEAALRILNRVWTNGIEPAGWIPPGPFQVRHSEIAEALIPLGYPDPHPAPVEALRDRHRRTTPADRRVARYRKASRGER